MRPPRQSCGARQRCSDSTGKGGEMQFSPGVVEAIGNTPLIKLNRASAETGCTILGKAEFMNPGQSVKDRPARQIILEAEKRGEIKPGGLVVEATAGNTGIGLALVANARGYRTLIVIPETQSQEKKDILRLGGAWRNNCARTSPTACCLRTSGTISTTARHITFRPVRKSGTRPRAGLTA